MFKNKILFTVSVLFLSSTISFAEVKNYYPEKFSSIISGQTQGMDSDRIKSYIRTIGLRAHIKHDGGRDTLVNSCAENNASNCYKRKILSYKQARRFLFGKLHLRSDQKGYYVKDVYCNRDYRTEGKSKVGPMKIPNSNILNCEHTWPQSRFNRNESSGGQKTDLHHLFPTNSRANSIRGNNPFAEVDSPSIFPTCAVSRSGDAREIIQNYISTKGRPYFEPPTEHKGNVARALFYFSTRYQLNISPVEEFFLRRWHELDPVDSDERERNDAIMEIQHNRNPFIDHPELVDLITDF